MDFLAKIVQKNALQHALGVIDSMVCVILGAYMAGKDISAMKVWSVWSNLFFYMYFVCFLPVLLSNVNHLSQRQRVVEFKKRS